MHMADALLTPSVGLAMWGASSLLITTSSRKIKRQMESHWVPLMGVLGAFVFAAQMINFTIPGTGSSGHLGGGLLLAIILGPWAAFITLSSVLTVQALFFADGGLLALGCNIFNLGVFPCFIAYPCIYKKILNGRPTPLRIFAGALPAAVIGLQLGAFAVVIQTVVSGMTDLPVRSFLLLMQSIHLGIGIVEGVVTGGVVAFLLRTRPEVLSVENRDVSAGCGIRRLLTVLLISAALIGGVLSWFSSSNPDGLEWSLLKIAGGETASHETWVYAFLSRVQEATAVLPDYGFREGEGKNESSVVDVGTSLSGLLGGGLTLLVLITVGFILKRHCAAERRKDDSEKIDVE